MPINNGNRMPQISVVIITFNEEKNIGRCLDSILPVADDVIVVDSFSTDKTQEIVLEKGCRFVQHKFDGHIEQKNWAITQAKFPHILSLDADEALSEELRNEILSAKQSWDADAYYFNRLTNYCGKWIKHCGWYPDQKLRLWDSRKGKWGGTNPHDKFELSPGASKKHLLGDLHHYSYYTISQHVLQIEKFSSISALQAVNKGKTMGIVGLLLKPIWKFIKDYFVRLGFLDGYYGFVICKLSAFATFTKCLKMIELGKSKT